MSEGLAGMNINGIRVDLKAGLATIHPFCERSCSFKNQVLVPFHLLECWKKSSAYENDSLHLTLGIVPAVSR